MVALPGFGPKPEASETPVLPLHYRAFFKYYTNVKYPLASSPMHFIP